METEIEGKFLDINVEEIKNKLKSLNAKMTHKERFMNSAIYDYEDKRLGKIGGWIRVRDEGNKVTLSYKQLNDRTLHGTKEVSLTINNFENACLFLESIGLKKKTVEEKKREEWILDEVEISIDTWPWIPTFLEMEGKNEKSLRNVCKKLDLNWDEVIHGSVEAAYQKYFNVTEDEVSNWASFVFTDNVPAWLEEKRIK